MTATADIHTRYRNAVTAGQVRGRLGVQQGIADLEAEVAAIDADPSLEWQTSGNTNGRGHRIEPIGAQRRAALKRLRT